MNIIGLTGPAGAGKDTVADYLVAAYGFTKVSFAAPLRNGIASMFGIPLETIEDRATKEKRIEWIGKSPRQLLQTLGTEWGRHHVAGDIWLRVAQHRIEHIQRNARYTGIKGIVISDVRFFNEADWLRERGQLVHITRPNTLYLSAGASSHSSEAGISPLTGESIIINDASPLDLERQVDAVIGFDQ